MPQHVIKSIVVGCLKRYIIISDTRGTYERERRDLYNVLLRQGWSREDIRRVSNKPDYRDRIKFINEFMENQETKKEEWIAEHTNEEEGTIRGEMIKRKTTDKSKIICVGKAFNAVYDDGRTFKEQVQKARDKHLTKTLASRELIIAMRGAKKCQQAFKRYGI